MLWFIFACTAPDTDDTDTEPVDTDEPFVAPEGGLISLETRDDVTLAADYFPVDSEGAPAIVLLHMTPRGGWSRVDWPAELITGLNGLGMTVIAIDRRGAGDSEGDPDEASVGEWGRYDVEAAVLRLVDDGYGDLYLLGASNGTTSMIDYADWAAGEGLPEPLALGFLSGGTYTENNTDLADIPVLPSLFAYGDDDTAWPESHTEDQPDDLWQFHHFVGGEHGTQLFTGDHAADTVDLLVTFYGEQ